jgi:hypothetical protein
MMSSAECSSSVARSHEVSSSVPSYPDHLTKYNNLHFRRWSTLESRTCAITYSCSLLMSTRDGGGWIQFRIVLGVSGSNIMMWKMGCMPHILSGRWRVKDREPNWRRGRNMSLLSLLMTHPFYCLSPHTTVFLLDSA